MKLKINASNIIGFISVIVAVILTAAVSYILYAHTVDLLTYNLRERLLAIVTTGSVQFDAVDIAELQQEQDWEKPEWEKVVTQLKKMKDNNEDIIFAYIFRKDKNDPSQLQFVSDAGSMNPYANVDDDPYNDVDVDNNGVIDDIDYLQWPGQEYPEPPEDAYNGFEGALTNRDLYEDAWGRVITGYAPIRHENGETEAVLAVDIRADEFFQITRQTLIPFLAFIFLLIGIISILSYALIRIWNKRIELLKDLDRQKDELLGIVAHQLSKPITALRWNLESLLDGDLGALNEEQKKETISMRSQAVNLADLVSMILDVSRIQLGKIQLTPQPLNLADLFKDIVDVMNPTIVEKNINFIQNLPKKLPVALLDKRYTRMTIENLLSNAVKYTPEGGKVMLDVSIENGMLRCSVADTGCGIPKADQEKIFGKMFRASNVRNAVDGNGFGLYIAKGAVEAQGGKMSFVSLEGKGTTFMVELPIKEA